MWRISLTHHGVAVVRAERATGALKARQAESTPAQAEHARWQMVESPGCARSAPLERRRRAGRSARQRRRSTLAHGGVTGEARIILRCSEAHSQATLSSYEIFSKVRKYESTNLLSYEGTFAVRVHVRCLIKVVGPNGLTVHVHVQYTCMCTIVL